MLSLRFLYLLHEVIVLLVFLLLLYFHFPLNILNMGLEEDYLLVPIRSFGLRDLDSLAHTVKLIELALVILVELHGFIILLLHVAVSTDYLLVCVLESFHFDLSGHKVQLAFDLNLFPLFSELATQLLHSLIDGFADLLSIDSLSDGVVTHNLGLFLLALLVAQFAVELTDLEIQLLVLRCELFYAVFLVAYGGGHLIDVRLLGEVDILHGLELHFH